MNKTKTIKPIRLNRAKLSSFKKKDKIFAYTFVQNDATKKIIKMNKFIGVKAYIQGCLIQGVEFSKDI